MPLFFFSPDGRISVAAVHSPLQQEIEHGVEPTPLTDERIEGAPLHDLLFHSWTILLPNTEAVGADCCCHRLDGTYHPFYF